MRIVSQSLFYRRMLSVAIRDKVMISQKRKKKSEVCCLTIILSIKPKTESTLKYLVTPTCTFSIQMVIFQKQIVVWLLTLSKFHQKW